MQYEKAKFGNYIIFAIKGDFTISNIRGFNEEYEQYIEANRYNFIFDLTETNFIDSSGMGTIFAGVDKTGKNKIKICINENNDLIKESFKIMRVSKLFQFYNNIQDAISNKNEIEL